MSSSVHNPTPMSRAPGTFFQRLRNALVYAFVSVFFFGEKNRNLRRAIRNTLSYNEITVGEIIRTAYAYRYKQPREFPYYLSLVMNVKDESKYIIEWIEYYLLQGVDHFYIYNNNGTDNTEELIKPYIDKGIVTWTEFHGKAMQTRIYNTALKDYRNETRWMGFVDIDEFIVPKKHATLAEALREFEDYSQLQIHWVFFGSCGYEKRPEGLVIENYTRHADDVDPRRKGIINPRACLSAEVHNHNVLGGTVNEHKKPYSRKELKPSVDIFQCNHYAVKSREEFLAKQKRGYATVEQFKEDYFALADRNEIDSPDLMKPYAQKIKAKLGSAGGNG